MVSAALFLLLLFAVAVSVWLMFGWQHRANAGDITCAALQAVCKSQAAVAWHASPCSSMLLFTMQQYDVYIQRVAVHLSVCVVCLCESRVQHNIGVKLLN